MVFWNAIKNQLRSVIQWESASSENLFELWSDRGDELKSASKLIVKPGQGAIFVYEGKIVQVHLQEGIFELDTANTPFLTTLSKYMQAFESEHKAAIYFFWQTDFLNQKWGTVSAVKYSDPVYGFPVALRAFGNFSFKILSPEKFFVNVVGAKKVYSVSELRNMFVARLVSPLSDLLASSGYGYLEIDKKRNELADNLKTELSGDFANLGFALTDFRIEGTEFDDETQLRVNTVANVQADQAGAKSAGLSFAELQHIKALREAAANPGGAAGAGVGIGAGVALGQMAVGQFGSIGAGAKSDSAESSKTPAERLQQLSQLLEGKLITQSEYDQRRAEIIKLL